MGRLALPARLTYYVQGRLPYAPSLAEVMQDTLELDGDGRRLDVGCGHAVIALRLAHLSTRWSVSTRTQR